MIRKEAFNRIITAAMLVTLTALMTVFIAGSEKATEVQAGSSSHTQTYYDERYNNGDLRVGYFEIDGGTFAMCACHELEPPSNIGATLNTVEEYTYENKAGEIMRKVMYYGWHGPEDIGGDSDGNHFRETTLALSVANGHSDNFYGYGQAFIDRIADLDAAPKGFNVYKVSSGQAGYQDLVYYEYNPVGYLQLEKESDSLVITDGNACYSLADAVYGVFSDEECTQQVAELKTDGDGKSNTVDLDYGEYFIKEITASKGYALDETVYPVTIESGETTIEKVREVPGNDPAVIDLIKIDKETGAQTTLGDAPGLEGAEFTIRYYDGYYSKVDALPKNATRQWVIKTVKGTTSSGAEVYRAALREDFKVAGDEFYYLTNYDGSKTVTLPLGTITVEETKAPTGYKLDNSYLISTEEGAKKVEGIYIAQIVEEEAGRLFKLQGGNEYEFANQIIRGGVKIQKRDDESGLEAPLGGGVLEGQNSRL